MYLVQSKYCQRWPNIKPERFNTDCVNEPLIPTWANVCGGAQMLNQRGAIVKKSSRNLASITCTLSQRWFSVGTASKTLVQHKNNTD